MATPAAVLSVMVEANTRSATTALSKFDSKLRGIDKTTATATTRTSALGKASRTTGSHLRSAAGYAASAAAAYLSISQAKAAISTTQELATTSGALSRNLGLSTKAASRWASVAQTRDIDTKQMNASFATLAKNVNEARKGTDTAVETFRGLGVSQRQLKKDGDDFGATLMRVADGFGEAEGGAQRQATAQTLLGRGYQNLLPLMAKGSDALQDQLRLGDQYGATMGKDAVKAQEALIAAQRESQRAWQGMQVTFTTALTPALKAANAEFQNIARILASDDLTNTQKFDQIAAIIGGWADKALDAFVLVLPKMIEKAGEAAPKIAGALVKGFLQADIWGKLLVGGWLISKFGGVAAFTAAGKTGGKFFGRGVGLGLLLAIPLLVPEIFKFGLKIGEGLRRAGPTVGEWFVNGMIDAINLGIRTINDVLDKANILGKLGVDAPNIGEIGAVDFTKDVVEAQRVTGKALRQMNREGTLNLSDLADNAEESGRDLSKSLDQWTGKGAKAVDKNFKNAVTAVKGSMKNAKAATDAGGRAIQASLFSQLRKYGIDDPGKFMSSVKSVAGAVGKGIKKQRGGVIVPGQGSGDKVPAMLEPGEVVLNRSAVAAMGGAQRANSVNRSIPRFAKGGIAPMVGEASRIDKLGLNYVWGGSHGVSPTPRNGPFDCSSAVSHILQSGGYDIPTMVSGQLAGWGAGGPGAVTIFANPEHTFMKLGSRYWGTSRTNPGGGPGWIPTPDAGYLSGFSVRHPSGMPTGGAIGGNVKLPRFAGNSLLGGITAAGLNQVAAATEKVAQKRMGAMSGGMGNSNLKLPAGSGQSLIENAWRRVNPGIGNPHVMSAIAMAESGGNEKAHGPPDGRGWYQIEWPVWGSQLSKFGNPYDGMANTRMAREVLQQQGLGAWVVHNTGADRQFLQGGGVVGPGGSAGRGASGGGGKNGKGKLTLKKSLDQISRLDEVIDIAGRTAAMPGSPAGADLSGGEKSHLVKLTQKLLGKLGDRRGLLRGMLRKKGLKGPRKHALEDMLTEVQGLTGRGGRIFDTKEALAGLRATALGGGESAAARADLLAEQLRIARLSLATSQAQYKVFQGMPVMHSGGVVPGPIGQPRTVLAQGGEVVSPLGGGAGIHLHFAPGTEWLRDFVKVTVGKETRRATRGVGRTPGSAGALR